MQMQALDVKFMVRALSQEVHVDEEMVQVTQG
jgi:hypothetical protein